MGVFFYLDMRFLQNHTIANTFKLYGVSDKILNRRINIFKTYKCVLQSIFTDSRGFTLHDQISSEIWIGTKQILISPRMGSIKAVSFGATNSWGLKFRRRGQNEDIRYFGSVWLCTRCRLFSRTNWKWVGRDSRWIWSRETSRVGCITKITGYDNCSYKINWNKDSTSTEFLLFQRRIEIRLWWELAIPPKTIHWASGRGEGNRNLLTISFQS